MSPDPGGKQASYQRVSRRNPVRPGLTGFLVREPGAFYPNWEGEVLLFVEKAPRSLAPDGAPVVGLPPDVAHPARGAPPEGELPGTLPHPPLHPGLERPLPRGPLRRAGARARPARPPRSGGGIAPLPARP